MNQEDETLLLRRQRSLDCWTKKDGWRIVDRVTSIKLENLASQYAFKIDRSGNRLYNVPEELLPDLRNFEEF